MRLEPAITPGLRGTHRTRRVRLLRGRARSRAAHEIGPSIKSLPLVGATGWSTSCNEIAVFKLTKARGVSLCESKDEVAARSSAAQSERRKHSRIELHWRVTLLVLPETGAIEAETRNLSSGGFYCCSPISFVPGEQMVCILNVPTHDPERRECMAQVECQVRIVRVDPPNDEELYGLGCEISDYRLLHA